MPAQIRFSRTLGSQDALLWRVEDHRLLRSTASAVTLLERGPERELLLETLRAAARAIPRLHQRVLSPPRVIFRPLWARDPYFDLDYHLRWLRAPRDGSLRALLDLAAVLAMQGFDRSRPLWEFAVVEDLADGGAALLQKLHHAVTDGSGGLRLMQHVYAREPGAAPAGDGARLDDAGPLRAGAEALLERLGEARAFARRRAARLLAGAAHPARAARDAWSLAASVAHLLTPTCAPLSPLMRQRSASYRFETLSVPLDGLKSAARAAGCKLNDAFLAAVAGGFRLYHERHRTPVGALRVALPIDLRAGAGGPVTGNRLMLARFPVPVGQPNPRERMRAIRARVSAERSEPALEYAEEIAGLLNLAPPLLMSALSGAVASSVDFVASCVPGPPEPLYVAGARVEALYTFGPTAGAAANLTLFRYRDQASVAINADPAAVPDHEALAECMREGFDEVLKLG